MSSLRRLKLVVAYDGANFSGWQSQADRNAVQDHLEAAFREVNGSAVRVHGAGRTDAGVHALAQVAHADVAKALTPARWVGALNASLPTQIRIVRAYYVGDEFHARFSARGKIYRYRIWSGAIFPPLELGRAWHVVETLDCVAMQSAAKTLVGRHDFAGFSANRGHPEKSTERTMHSIRISRRASLIVITLDADGFLYKMARMIAGTLVQRGAGKISHLETVKRLQGGRGDGPRLVAPASGLFLVRVRY